MCYKIISERKILNNILGVNIVSPQGNETFSNEQINISWNSSDVDGDNLNHTVILMREDDGVNITVDFDISDSSLIVNSTDFRDCSSCRIKLLVTDGVNGNFSVSDSFSIDNDLQITTFNVIFQNNTERAFKINLNNTLSSTISNISWKFDSGENIENSQFDFSLNTNGKMSFFIYHNYSSSGNYTAAFTVESGNFIESESLEVEI